jgi:hypothetical protein
VSLFEQNKSIKIASAMTPNSKKIKCLLFLMIFTLLFSQAQTITVHSVHDQRSSPIQPGYTLNGSYMSPARQKLLNTANFGPAGIYPNPISIVDGYLAVGSLTQATSLSYNDIFFFGFFDKTSNTNTFTIGEIDSLCNWSKRCGKMIICAGQTLQPTPPVSPADSRVLDFKWGISWITANPSFFYPTNLGNSTDIFNGPFGNVSSANQAGSLQGYFDPLNNNTKILATNPDGRPTLVMDCNTLDLIAADVDGYTWVGNNMSMGNLIQTTQDKFWANTIVFMNKLQPLPLLTNSNNTLSLNSNYVNYQWYHNNQAISGATGATYVQSQPGVYYVKVTLNGGCILKSDSSVVHGEVGLGINEKENAYDMSLIFPNPSETKTTVVFKNELSDVIVNICDEQGKEIVSQKFSGKTMEIESNKLAKGIYLINIISENRMIMKKKIIIN